MNHPFHLWVGKQDGGIVIDLRIGAGLVLLQAGDHRFRLLAFQHPGEQIGSVAAEIDHGSPTVQDRIGEPIEELRIDIDLLRTFVPIINDHFPEVAHLAVGDHLVPFVMGRIPGGFIVCQHHDAILVGQALDFGGVFRAHGQGLFNHHVNTPWSTGFHHREVFEDGREGNHPLRPCGIEHVIERCIDDALVDAELPGITIRKCSVPFRNPDNLHVGPVEASQQRNHMRMRQPRNPDPNLFLSANCGNTSHQKRSH